jgi:hypothetical protein
MSYVEGRSLNIEYRWAKGNYSQLPSFAADRTESRQNASAPGANRTCRDLDKVVRPDHLVRQIDGLLDLGWVHKELALFAHWPAFD